MSLRPVYRIRQFWLALLGSARPVEEEVLCKYLNAEQIGLFRRMPIAEQAHALAVLRTLQAPSKGYAVRPGGRRPNEGVPTPKRGYGAPRDGEQELGVAPALAQAALLHDVGKVGGLIRLWHRVAAVLLNALSPALLQRLALDQPQTPKRGYGVPGWRYPFFVLLHHAERGADLAAGAGTDAVAVALIRAHHTPKRGYGVPTPKRGFGVPTTPEQSGLDAQGRTWLGALQSADEEN